MRSIIFHFSLLLCSLYVVDFGSAFSEVPERQHNVEEPRFSNASPESVALRSRNLLSDFSPPPPPRTQQTRRRRRRLEFVHITKTGGSAVEKAAASAGVRWGACHYKSLPKLGCTDPDVPRFDGRSTMTRYRDITEPWHVPLQFHNVIDDNDPFFNAATFTIVRNPYDRVLSEYHCPYGGDGKGPDWENPDKMNAFLRHRIERAVHTEKSAHYLPQHYYIYHEGKRYVDHILHYETLSEEFPKLMAYYDLNDIILPAREGETSSRRKKLTVKDLDRSTIDLINETSRQDFLLFGYEMM